ncbi:MAG: glycosyltransferase, partial [Spirulinaceae cyanobacterium]
MNLEPQNRISVITPVYNGAKYIEACLQVVIAQNCSQIEHIIIDGNSQDCTVDIVQKYAEKYSHIRFISAPDQRQSDAMNKGVSLAKGNIIAILNVDDYYEANVLNRVLELFTDLP